MTTTEMAREDLIKALLAEIGESTWPDGTPITAESVKAAAVDPEGWGIYYLDDALAGDLEAVIYVRQSFGLPPL